MSENASGGATGRGMSILVRIVAIFFVSMAIVVGLLFFLFGRTIENAATASIRKSSLGYTQLEAEQIAEPLALRQVAVIDQKLAKLAEVEGNLLVGALVFDAQGTEVTRLGEWAGATAGGAATDATAAMESGQTVEAEGGRRITAPIFDPDGSIVGALSVQRTAQRALAQARRSMLIEFTMAGAIFVALMIVTAFLLRHWVSRPIVALGRRTRDMAAGDLSSEVPGTGRRDEIGQTSIALEKLRGQLEEAERSTRDAVVAGAGFASSSAPQVLTDLNFAVIQHNDAFRVECAPLMKAIGAAESEVPADFLVRISGFDPAALAAAGLPAEANLEIEAKSFALGMNRIEHDGQPIGYVVECADVTSSRSDTATLTALDSSMLRASFDKSGALTETNPRFETLLGSDPFSGRPPWEVLALEEENRSFAEAAASGETVVGEMTIGDMVLSAAFAPVRDPRGKTAGFVLLASDITETRTKAAEAERERKAMEAA